MAAALGFALLLGALSFTWRPRAEPVELNCAGPSLTLEPPMSFKPADWTVLGDSGLVDRDVLPCFERDLAVELPNSVMQGGGDRGAYSYLVRRDQLSRAKDAFSRLAKRYSGAVYAQ